MNMDNASELGKALKEWRASKGYTTFQIAKEEGGKLRYEYLNKFETDGGGSARTLCAYLHFAITHGFKLNKSHLFENRKYDVDQTRKNDVTSTRKNEVEDSESSTLKASLPQGEDPTQKEAIIEQHQQTSEQNTVSKESDEDALIHAIKKQREGVLLNAKDQVVLIHHGICPSCGSSLIQRKNGSTGEQFVSCSKWLPEHKGCNYNAGGTLLKPEIKSWNEEGIIAKMM